MESVEPLLTLTSTAVSQIEIFIEEQGISDNVGLRVGVLPGGCSGFQYVWDFKKNWPDVKWSAPIDDVLVLDPMAEIYVLGSTIDYVEELGGSFLQIKNPTAASSCGCGESFGL